MKDVVAVLIVIAALAVVRVVDEHMRPRWPAAMLLRTGPATGASQSHHDCEPPAVWRVLCGMEQSDRRLIPMDSSGKREPKRPAAAKPASVDGWLDEHQWLTGLPAGSGETVIWGWWQPK